MPSYKELLPNIQAFILDVDGVLTDNTVYLHPSGELLRSMNVKDGYAMKVAIDKGIKICIITGGFSQSVKQRLETLGIKDVYLGISDKLTVLKEFLANNNLDPANCAYVGDDIPDYPVMRYCGLAVAPKDACQEILSVANYVSPYEGGKGCVRDIIEQTLRVQSKWFDVYVTST